MSDRIPNIQKLVNNKLYQEFYKEISRFEFSLYELLDKLERGCNQVWIDGTQNSGIYFSEITRNKTDPGFITGWVFTHGYMFSLEFCERSDKRGVSLPVKLGSIQYEGLILNVDKHFPLLKSWIAKNPEFWYGLLRTEESNRYLKSQQTIQ